jgi:hypothetical protein
MKQDIIDTGIYTGVDLMKIQACEDDPKKLWDLIVQIHKERQ